MTTTASRPATRSGPASGAGDEVVRSADLLGLVGDVPRRPGAVDRLAGALVRAAARHSSGGTLVVRGPDRTDRFGSGEPVATVTVHDPRAWRALALRGSVGLGTSYVAGWWDADDLVATVRLLVARTARLRSVLDGAVPHVAPVLDLVARRGPDRTTDRRNIGAHYDLSNEFFALMLDETMAYSCAVFEDEGMDLADAQRAKFDRLCRKLDLRPGDRLVEIGTGWGGLAIHAARHYGAHVTTTTISDEQRALAVERVEAAGLAGRVTVLGRDWRDLDGTYDKLVSVEMIEAVDWRWHDAFLATCARLLRPDGLAAIQAIVIADRSFERAKRHDDFIRRMIFPGGCIPSVTALAASATRATDLRIVDVEDIGRHYARTLHLWAENLEAAGGRVAELGVTPAFRRLWDLYLAYCEAGFLERHISDVQIVLAKPAWRGRLAARPC
ncbi:MAG: cyclopropane-fatty-acyl-phospholipid synthase [Actinomycetota bacterium]|nr:cyclopropane-fatty-acyl-phospholipid synthase [Actinomycetota bacterium]